MTIARFKKKHSTLLNIERNIVPNGLKPSNGSPPTKDSGIKIYSSHLPYMCKNSVSFLSMFRAFDIYGFDISSPHQNFSLCLYFFYSPSRHRVFICTVLQCDLPPFGPHCGEAPPPPGRDMNPGDRRSIEAGTPLATFFMMASSSWWESFRLRCFSSLSVI